MVAGLLLALSPVWAGDAPAPDLSLPVMEFVHVRSNAGCEPVCAEWISAEGRIDATVPDKLAVVIASTGGRALPLVLASGGGDVRAAMKMGSMLRAADMPVYIGRTRFQGCDFTKPLCPEGQKQGSVMLGTITSFKALCYSACPMVLAGGEPRIVGQRALVGVHQITVGREQVKITYETEVETKNGQKTIVDRKEVKRESAGVTYSTDMSPQMRQAIDDYWRDMGVDPDVTNMMMTASPRGIRRISQDDLVRLRLKTRDGEAEELASPTYCNGKTGDQACVDTPG